MRVGNVGTVSKCTEVNLIAQCTKKERTLRLEHLGMPWEEPPSREEEKLMMEADKDQLER